ncbi:MAG TPA: phosphonate metabolism protein/1,5-bisphosphokinase (PRPP-forming) PhnN [Mesorhizobium sp.]|jgi:ribose 1,5-bisphosphokinase|nr:phosphonate metabolism protein/1,5-bisphosphokinase (PRPP-forming) PhnN [Mesorhizobium sp.]
MTGVFVAVVGPSGAGKDTLIAGARERLSADGRFAFPRRAVTRESSRFEDHDVVSPERFAALGAQGAFALSWAAHGLRYGIPAGVDGDLAQGRAAVCNLSRGALGTAKARFPWVRVVLVTAPREILGERILARGRESAEEVERRLDREAAKAMPPADCTVENVGPVEGHIGRLVEFLLDLAEPRRGLAIAKAAS